jgi:hypothetical protein
MNEPSRASADARYGTGLEAARPYFEIIETALDGLVDGETYFDFLADGFVFEFPFALTGWPATIEGGRPSSPISRGTATGSSSTGPTGW